MISRSDDKQAANLLRESGKSFREISNALHISVSTAHEWTKGVVLTSEQTAFLTQRRLAQFQAGRKIGSTAKRIHRESIEKDAQKQATDDFIAFRSDAFFMTGLSLYWAEGFKKDHSLGFVNSDPTMSLIFLKWLKKYGGIDTAVLRARVQINKIYESRYQEIESFWSTTLEIPTSQFQRPFFQTSKRTTIVDSHYRGQVRIRAIGSRNFFVKILTWIELLKSIHSSKL